MASSQNGWTVVPAGALPHNTPSGQPRCRHTLLPIVGQKIFLRDGIVALVLADLIITFHKRIEKIPGPVLDDWGYAYREIVDSDDMSNHASATAVDLNATQHPLSAVGTFTLIQQWRIRRMLKRRYKGLIRWGGDYRGRKDEMHFEVNCTHAELRTLALSLMDKRRGQKILDANPGLRAVIRG